MRALHPLAALLVLAACHKPIDGNAASNVGVANAAAPAPKKLDRTHAGQAAPDTTFEDPHGKPVTLARFRGKPLLVNLWATWCAPCKKELPTLDRLAAEQGDKLQVLTIGEEDTDGRRKVDAYFAQAKFARLEAWLDPKLALTDSLKVNDLPTTILFDRAGREIWRVTADKDWTGAEARALIAEGRR
jgi:thiol-disulfide isomerase/thioredoxin